jgi:ribonuclease Z
MRRLLVLGLLVTTLACDRLVDRQIAANFGRARTEMLTSPDLQVVLCGTGSPLPDPNRASACTAIVAGGELVLVDAGPGSWKVADLANLPTSALGAVLLTHFHSDHIGDLGEAIVQSWIAGRTRPLDVYGPPGTARVVDGLAQAYAADVDYRVAHHGEQNLPRAAAGAVAHEVPLPADPNGSVPVFERNGLRVTMFRVDHTPVSPAVGYRFDYRGRSVVISGDTAKSPSLIANAKGADILIHEALNADLVQRAGRVARATGRDRLAAMSGDILNYHATPVQAAESAREAGAKHLILTHLVPGPSNVLVRRMFLEGVDDAYDGEVTLGEDGAEFTLPPAAGH